MVVERVHAVFVGGCVVLSVLVGLWALSDADWILGVGALLGGAALGVSSGLIVGSGTKARTSIGNAATPGGHTMTTAPVTR